MRILAQATFAFRSHKAEQVGIFELAVGVPLKRPKEPKRYSVAWSDWKEWGPEGAIPVHIRRADRRRPKKRRWLLRWTGKRFCADRDRESLPKHILEWAKNELAPRGIGADWT
jgi:hypothetical protein